MLRALLTHNPEDRAAYFARALPDLELVAEVVVNPLDRDLAPDELIAAAAGCQVIVAHRSTPGGAGVFEQLPDLVAFLRCAVDISTVDVPAATAAGVLVANADKSFVASTAELALALMLDLARHVSESTVDYRAGISPPQRQGRQLRGRTAGIIGYGAIGAHLAILLRAVGMRVVVCDPGAGAIEHAEAEGFVVVPLDELLDVAEFVLPLAPASAATAGLIGTAALARMQPGALLVNVSRGELLDEDAVGAALDSGHLGGLAMDVGQAPDQRPSPVLAGRPGVVATPHLGGLTPENADAQAMSAVEQVRAIVAGVVPDRTVNAEAASRLRAWWAVQP